MKLGEHGAVEVIFTRDGTTVYASQMETASVYEIDRATRTVKRQFKTGRRLDQGACCCPPTRRPSGPPTGSATTYRRSTWPPARSSA